VRSLGLRAPSGLRANANDVAIENVKLENEGWEWDNAVEVPPGTALDAASSCVHSSGPIWSDAAAMFSSRCFTCDVPGMGSITGERWRSHAMESCAGVALWRLASSASVCEKGWSGLSSLPPAIGYQGRKAIRRCSHQVRVCSWRRSARE
jgi:hypothetical protein